MVNKSIESLEETTNTRKFHHAKLLNKKQLETRNTQQANETKTDKMQNKSQTKTK